MRRMDQYSQSLKGDSRGRSVSPKGLRDWKSLTGGGGGGDAEAAAPAGTQKDKVEQDAAILKSLWGDDVKIRQGQALMKPSEIRNRTPGKKRQKDWGECPLTFDQIKEPVRAGDGKVYERWAIKKWLEENNNRSPLTNVNIGPELTPLKDEEEGTVKGERSAVESDARAARSEIKTEINTVLNAVRGVIPVDESAYTEIPSSSHSVHASGAPRYPITPNAASVSNTSAAEEPGGGGGAAAAGGGDMHKRIAGIMRDTSLTAQQKNERINAIRAGRPPPEDLPAPVPTPAPAPVPAPTPAAAAAARGGVAGDDANKRIADIMRDQALTAQQKNDRINAIRAGKPPPPDPAPNAPPPPMARGNTFTEGSSRGGELGRGGGIDWSSVKPVPEPFHRRESAGALPSTGSKGGSLDSAPPAAAPTQAPGAGGGGKGGEPPQPEAPAPAAPAAGGGGGDGSNPKVSSSNRVGGGGGSPAKPTQERSHSRGKLRHVFSWMGGGGGKSDAGRKEPPEAAAEPPEAGGRRMSAGEQGAHPPPAAPPQLAHGKTFSEGSTRQKQQQQQHQQQQQQQQPQQQWPEVEFAEVARAWGIHFGQYPKQDPAHASALFVLHLKPGGPADESEQVMVGDILFEVDGVAAYRQSIEHVQRSLHGPSRGGGAQVELRFKRPGMRVRGTPLSPEPAEALESVHVRLKSQPDAAQGGGAPQAAAPQPSAGDAERMALEGQLEELKGRLREREGEVLRAQQQQAAQQQQQQQQQQHMDRLQQQLSHQIELTQQQLAQQQQASQLPREEQSKLQQHIEKLQGQLLQTQTQLQESQDLQLQQHRQLQKQLQLGPKQEEEIERLKRQLQSEQAERAKQRAASMPEKLQLHPALALRPVRYGVHPELQSGLEIQADKAPFSHFGADCWAFRDMLRGRECLDLALVCPDGKVVRAHRAVMCAASPPLRRALRGEGGVPAVGAVGPIGAETHVQLMECKASIAQALVNFVYEGRLRVEASHELFELHRAAAALQVPGLGEACEDGILASLQADTCAELLGWCAAEGVERVADACRALALEEFAAVAASPQFPSLPEAEVDALLRSDQLRVRDEEQVWEGLAPWLRAGAPPGSLRGERLLGNVRFATMALPYLQGILASQDAKASGKLRRLIDEAEQLHSVGARAQPRSGAASTAASAAAAAARDPGGEAPSQPAKPRPPPPAAAAAAPREASPRAAAAPTQPAAAPTKPVLEKQPSAGAPPQTPAFRFDRERSHPIVAIRESGMVAEISEDGDSEHSAIVTPPLPRTGQHYIEFLLEETGTPETYIQIGVCRGTHDVKGGTPAYQSDSGWCFSCHNGNLLHFDTGSKYSRRLPRAGDLVGLQVDMDLRSLQMFVNGEPQGVMVDGLPGSLYFVVDGGDEGQRVRITGATRPGGRRAGRG